MSSLSKIICCVRNYKITLVMFVVAGLIYLNSKTMTAVDIVISTILSTFEPKTKLPE